MKIFSYVLKKFWKVFSNKIKGFPFFEANFSHDKKVFCREQVTKHLKVKKIVVFLNIKGGLSSINVKRTCH